MVSILDIFGKLIQGEHHLSDLVWVNFDFGYSTICPILPGHMKVWQNGLSSWARWVEYPNQSQP